MRARIGASRMPFYASAMRACDIDDASRVPFCISAMRARNIYIASQEPFGISAMRVRATSKVHRASLFRQARCARTARVFTIPFNPVVESDGLYEHGVLDMHRAPRNEVNEDNEVNEVNEGNEVNEVGEDNEVKIIKPIDANMYV
jgi:hypothetical protein